MSEGAGEHLEALERRWRQSGRLEDECALLRARVRAGVLVAPRLSLAAYFGHEAARQTLPHGGGRLASAHEASWLLGVSVDTLRRWCREERAPCPHTRVKRARRFDLRRVARWRFEQRPEEVRMSEIAARVCHLYAGPEGAGRAAVAVARDLVRRWPEQASAPVDPDIAAGLDAMESWLGSGDEAERQRAARVGAGLRERYLEAAAEDEGWAAWAARACASAVLTAADYHSPAAAEAAVAFALLALGDEGGWSMADTARLREGEAELESVMAAEVVPWALGHGDSVGERGRGRGRR